MLSSMTGFGRGQASDSGYVLTVEMNSVNSRYAEVSARIPRSISILEPRIVELVKNGIARGKVNVTVSIETESGGVGREIAADVDLGRAYHDAAVELREQLGLVGEIDLTSILRFPDIIATRESEPNTELIRSLVETATGAALTELHEMRVREGQALAADFTERMVTVRAQLAKVEERAPERVEAAKLRLEERVETLLSGNVIDPQRIAMEVAMLADKYDVAEEITRLKSHLDQFEVLMSQDNAGRKLNFLLQEMNREVNTIGSKSNDADMAHLVVEMKEEIERLREQVQNVE